MRITKGTVHLGRKPDLPGDVLKYLETYRNSCLLAQHCTFDSIEPGRYKIDFVCVENMHSRDETALPQGAENRYLGKIVDLSRTLITFGLDDEHGDFVVLQRTADEHTADFVRSLVGRHLLSDGGNVFLEGGSCSLVARGKEDAIPDGFSLMAPRQARAREEFISELGLLRYAKLLPLVSYKIDGVSYKEGTNHLSNDKRRFIELEVSEVQKERETEEQHLEDSGRITVRIYLRKTDEPLRNRVLGFLSMRKGLVFQPSQAIPTTVGAAEIDMVLEQFGVAGKQPQLRRGELYLLEGVHANAPWKAHVFYRRILLDPNGSETESITEPPLVIKAYPGFAHRQGKDPMPRFMVGRTIDSLTGYFNPIVLDDKKEKVVFTVMRDVYAGMLDFLLWKGAESENIFSVGHIDTKDVDAQRKFVDKALARHKYNRISIRRYEQE